MQLKQLNTTSIRRLGGLRYIGMRRLGSLRYIAISDPVLKEFLFTVLVPGTVAVYLPLQIAENPTQTINSQ